MLVYRIVKLKKRTRDLSGMGAFLAGGRWNNPGTFALYTSENPSLALLEVLVHMDESDLPPRMYLMEMEIDADLPLPHVSIRELAKDWRVPENIKLKQLGDNLLGAAETIGFIVPSAILTSQHNIILNPAFPSFWDHVRVVQVELLEIDRKW